ncbi:hypothetical protein BDZ85DRAFT_279138 [Elsinoe ampelina]|uniref:Hypervirulence associated protein TUDOR domain-containing protein n=1 Tax=Elsinoe ampelina TaxID=302913 RepID=A0A6A6GJ21_9PEZI|nr:hypothetical protein BDZ85DRAFT_279138 [Elsinoe ampelina]
MPPKGKYTDPKLRDEVKEELHNSDKGGAPGQWSARKAQMMASEYKKRGGSYTTDKETGQDESGKNLEKWGKEDWQTKEGSGSAKKDDGTEKRYLPKKAWENMTDAEKEATEKAKQKGSKQGKQHVANTSRAKEERKKAGGNAKQDEDEEKDEEKDQNADEGKNKGNQGKKRKAQPTSDKKDDASPEPETKTRRTTRSSTKQQSSSTQDQSSTSESKSNTDKKNGDKTDKNSSGKTDEKSPKESHAVNGKSTYGSKHQSPTAPGTAGSSSRLPSKGQKVTWKAMPGWVEGEVIEVVTAKKKVEGKEVKGSESDPRVVLRSHGPSGKVAVHKAEAVFWD